MKIPRRLLVTAVALIFISGATTLAVLQADTKPNVASVQETPIVNAAVEAQLTPVENTPVAREPVRTVERQGIQETEPEQLKHGEDPAKPGYYRVFDTDWALSEAGISKGDKVYVEKVVGSWSYKKVGANINLCGANPAEKMKSFGSDYLNNPVTQLKWCDNYATARYGSWQAAAAYIDTHNRSF